MLRSIPYHPQAQQAAGAGDSDGTPQDVSPQQLAGLSLAVGAISSWVTKVSQAMPWGSLTQALSDRA